MPINKLILGAAVLLSSFALTANADKQPSSKYIPLAFENTRVEGELNGRLQRNFNRLEEEKYRPENVFLTEQQSGYWPGDTEGRTVLALVMDARATGREPKYLAEIIRKIPQNLNELGYMGTIHKDSLDEQQLSGNGWMLRALCEYYLWKKDKSMLPIIRRMAENLFVKGADYYKSYPISPDSRKKGEGEASGSLSQIIGHWRLSTDIGCVFIGMEGLLHALQVTGDKNLQGVADQLVSLFQKVDLTGIKAQTHASLTAMRGLIRYSDITGDAQYISKVEKYWETYRHYGMTEFYGNYNWFCRYDTWTEPCAIVDAFMVAAQLWQHTGKAEYRDDAEKIYYNAICHAQRVNGGFGLENSPGKANETNSVSINCDEAHWCCTMRGGEGLGRAAEYSAYKMEGGLAFPYFRNVTATENIKKVGKAKIEISTDYPFGKQVTAKVAVAPKKAMKLAFEKAEWMKDYKVTVNGEPVKYAEADGLATITRKFATGDEIKISFDMAPRFVETINKENTAGGDFKVMYGPLVLAGDNGTDENIAKDEEMLVKNGTSYYSKRNLTNVSPLYHFMSKDVKSGDNPRYSRRIIFNGQPE